MSEDPKLGELRMIDGVPHVWVENWEKADPMIGLRALLSDWTDWDVASYHVGQCLGLFLSSHSFATDCKHVFWTDNPVGNALMAILDELSERGVLEHRDEPECQFRWSPSFVGSWEVSVDSPGSAPTSQRPPPNTQTP